MSNKKQIVIGIVGLIFLGTLGVFGYLYQSKLNLTKSTPEAVKTQVSVEEVKATEKASAVTPKDFIEIDSIKVGMVVPEKWGHLVVPQTSVEKQISNDFKQVLNPPESFGIKDDELISYITYDFVGPAFTKIFSDYMFPLKTEESQWLNVAYTEIPKVTLIQLPTNFQDDTNVEEGPGRRAYTAKEKKRDIDELFNTWNQRKVTFQNVVDKEWNRTFPEVSSVQETKDFLEETEKQEIYWWGARMVNANEDRVAPKYWESQNGEFRGLGFFTTLSQEYPWGFYSYRVVLVNPGKYIALQIDLPLSLGSNDTLINSQHPEPSSDIERAKIIDEAYKYVENEQNYKGTDLEQFMKDIQGIVDSLQFIEK